MNGGLVSWSSFRCYFVAVSSAEVAYVSLAEYIQKVQDFHHILLKLGGFHEPTVIYEGNQPFILWAKEGGRSNRHGNVRYHIFREAAMCREARLEFFPPTKMIADMLKKPLKLEKILRFSKLMPSLKSFSFADNEWACSVCRSRVLELQHNVIRFLH